MSDVLLVVSATVPPPVDRPRGPRKDYVELARALDATVIDRAAVARAWDARLIGRVGGTALAQAWLAFRQRSQHRVILTDGEHIGIPLAALLKLAGARVPHVTIGHRLSSRYKRPLLRWLKLHTHLSRIALHSQRQHQIAVEALGIAPQRLALVPYQVDADFWRPLDAAEERLVVSAGLEHRDYPTLFRAAQGLDAHVVIGAASYWSHQRNTARDAACPPNVQIGSFDYFALRDLYARAAVVVVPLADVDFQAGVTTVLEAMAMGKAVVVTHSQGQVDMVEDRRAVTRGQPPRPRPTSLLRLLAAEEHATVEPNGFYVPPGDPDALRAAITYLLDHPAERAQLGAAGRRAVEQLLTTDHFVQRLGALVDAARSASTPSRSARPAPQRLALGRRQDT